MYRVPVTLFDRVGWPHGSVLIRRLHAGRITHAHAHKTLSLAMPSSIPFGNKVGRAPPSSTSVVTLAWEHPFPVGVVNSTKTKVPQPALHNPYQPNTAMPHNLSFGHSLPTAGRDGLHPAQVLKRNGA